MSDGTYDPSLSGKVRTMQIIVCALATGVIIFGSFVLFGSRPARPQQGTLLTLMSVCLGVTNAALAAVVPRIISSSQRKKIAAGNWIPPQSTSSVSETDADRLAIVYQTKMIVGAAMLEGAAFFALVAHLSERQNASLGVAMVMLVGLLAHFPTVGRVQNWIAEQLQQISDERGLG